ncbi:MAG: hypothetical protein CL855_07675 [Cryomorphaceae bacterium]|nr:hypothetical protein [Cryomorphaceae bacterium]
MKDETEPLFWFLSITQKLRLKMNLINVFFTLLFTSTIYAQGAKEIIENADSKLRGKSSYSEMSITIVRPK